MYPTSNAEDGEKDNLDFFIRFHTDMVLERMDSNT